jgi:hypothetical protein
MEVTDPQIHCTDSAEDKSEKFTFLCGKYVDLSHTYRGQVCDQPKCIHLEYGMADKYRGTQ